MTDEEDNERFIQASIEKHHAEIFRTDELGYFVPFHKRPVQPKNPGCGCLLKKQDD